MAAHVSSTTDDSGISAQEPNKAWPPHFPHRHIDGLIAELEVAESLDTAEATELLALVAVEAQRLRATVVRLSAARLSAAEREANAIVADAHSHAESLRALAMDVLVHRLDEAETLMAALRQTFPSVTSAHVTPARSARQP